MLIAVASTRGAPGVTTTALLLGRLAADAGWNTTVVEADPDGGVLAHLFPGLSPEPSLLDYAVAARRDQSLALFDEHTHRLEDTAATVMLAPSLGEEVTRALKVGSDTLVKVANTRGRMVVVDCGRVGNAAARVFNAAHHRILLARPEGAVALGIKALFEAHPDHARSIRTVLVGDKPYGPADLEDVGVPVAGVLADDPRTAEQIRGAAELNVKKFGRTALVRSAAGLVPALADDPVPPDAEPADDVTDATPEDAPEDAITDGTPEADGPDGPDDADGGTAPVGEWEFEEAGTEPPTTPDAEWPPAEERADDADDLDELLATVQGDAPPADWSPDN